MSFTTYPIITQGSNIDILRQGHNLITTNVGDMQGLQTSANETLVDAINSLNAAFSALTVSAYPPLNNEQWLTAYNFSGFGTLNLFKVSAANEFVIGQHVIPLSTLIDLGKAGTAWREGHITTLKTNKIQIISGSDLEYITTTSHVFKFTSGLIGFAYVSAGQLNLITPTEALDIKSTFTRIYSGTMHWDFYPTTGHLEPGANGTQNIGSATKEINRVYTKNITASGDVTFNADIIAPNAGLAVPIGGGCLWFLPTPPANYLIADGSTPLIASYPILAALYGTTYGGNGTTTFGLPNMKGRIPIGADSTVTTPTDISAPGKVFGTLNHIHNTTMPKHYHGVGALSVAQHAAQTTGNASNFDTLSADFTGNNLPDHNHGVVEPNGGEGHTHGIQNRGTGQYLNQQPHAHGAGLGDHSHPLNTGTRSAGGAVATDTGPNWATPANYGSAQIGLFTGLGDGDVFTYGAGGLGVGVAGDYANIQLIDPGHNHDMNRATTGITLTGVRNLSNVAINLQPSGTIKVNNRDHTHSTPALTHTVSGTVGITAGGANGDVDNLLVSTASNPPSFCVHYIIRAK